MKRAPSTPFSIVMECTATEAHSDDVANVPEALSLQITAELVQRLREADEMIRKLGISRMDLVLNGLANPLYTPGEEQALAGPEGLVLVFDGLNSLAYILGDGVDENGRTLYDAVNSDVFRIGDYVSIFEGIDLGPDFIPEEFAENVFNEGGVEVKNVWLANHP